jgi:ribosome biogenesis GTPase
LPGFDLGGLGWNPELAENLEPGLVPGRVAAVHRGAFDVWTETGPVRSRLPGRLMHDGLDVGVGDWVGLSDGLIRTVLPRRSAIVRNAASDQHRQTHGQTLAANVDVAFVVSSLGPDSSRAASSATRHDLESGATPRSCSRRPTASTTPAAGCGSRGRRGRGPRPRRLGRDRRGLRRAPRPHAPGTTAVLLGSSGVGKSTLVNLWLGEEVMVTGRPARTTTRAPHDVHASCSSFRAGGS